MITAVRAQFGILAGLAQEENRQGGGREGRGRMTHRAELVGVCITRR